MATSYVLIIVIISGGFSDRGDVKRLLTASSQELCEQARAELAKLPRLSADYMACVPGRR